MVTVDTYYRNKDFFSDMATLPLVACHTRQWSGILTKEQPNHKIAQHYVFGFNI